MTVNQTAIDGIVATFQQKGVFRVPFATAPSGLGPAREVVDYLGVKLGLSELWQSYESEYGELNSIAGSQALCRAIVQAESQNDAVRIVEVSRPQNSPTYTIELAFDFHFLPESIVSFNGVRFSVFGFAFHHHGQEV